MLKPSIVGILTATTLLTGAAHAAGPTVRMTADWDCLAGGGAAFRFTVRNVGPRTVRIDPDFHLRIEPVRPGPIDSGMVLFVFPAPGWDVIRPHREVTFLLTAGTPEFGEEPVDLSGARVLVEAQVYLRGRDHPAVKTFSFPGCPAP